MTIGNPEYDLSRDRVNGYIKWFGSFGSPYHRYNEKTDCWEHLSDQEIEQICWERRGHDCALNSDEMLKKVAEYKMLNPQFYTYGQDNYMEDL